MLVTGYGGKNKLDILVCQAWCVTIQVRVNVIVQRKIKCSFWVNSELTMTVKHEMIASNINNGRMGKRVSTPTATRCTSCNLAKQMKTQCGQYPLII